MKKLLVAFCLLFVLHGVADAQRLSPQGGTITNVVAGAGTTGGGTGGAVTINVIATSGGGITVNANDLGITPCVTVGHTRVWDGDSWECGAVGAGTVTGTGTANTITKWTGTSTQGDGSATDNGTTFAIGINTTINGTLNTTGNITENSVRVFTVAGTGATSSGGTINVVGATNSLTANANDLQIADRDFGSLTFSSGGTVATVDNDAISYAQIQNVVNNNRVLCRISGAGGDVEECTGAQIITLTGGVTGSGTNNTGTKWTGTGTIGNASFTDNGTTFAIGINTTVAGTLNTTGNLTENSVRVFTVAGNGLGSSGGTVSVNTGTGITITSDNVTLNMTAQTCGAGQHISQVTATGVFTCSASGGSGDITDVNLTGQGVVSGGTCSSGACAPVIGEVVERITSAGTYNDYALSTTTTVLQCSNGGTTNISSIANGYNGRRLTLTNDPQPSDPICRIRDESFGGGTAANRIKLLYGTDLNLGVQANSIELVYVAGDVDRWVQVDMFDATVAGAFLSESGNTIGLQNCTNTGDFPYWNAGWFCGNIFTEIDGFRYAPQSTTTTGNLDDFALNNGATALLFTGGSGTTIRGVTGGGDGRDLHLVPSLSSGTFAISDQNAGSTAANRIITGTGGAWTQAAGATLVYDGGDSRWRVVGYVGTIYPTITTTGGVVLGDSSGDIHVIQGVVRLDGAQIRDTGTVPTISACGTSPTATGGRVSFAITVGTGTITSCTATFSTVFTASPSCSLGLQADDAQAAAAGGVPSLRMSAVSASAITIESDLNVAGMILHAVCIGD